MRIKRTPTGNEYIRGGNVWVRNFTKRGVVPMNISHLYSKSDYEIVLQNEEANKQRPSISNEKLQFRKVIIVSDGYDFEQQHRLIAKMPPDVCILAINGALRNWKLMGVPERRSINAYLINNPYKDSLKFLPAKHSQYFPVCIASSRTSHDFISRYRGSVYLYSPTPERVFGTDSDENYYIDDYRNPVCAAIGFAFQLGVEKLMLMCCDDSFEEKRDAAIRLANGLWTYPQQLLCQQIIDANLYWLTHQEDHPVQVVDCSSGSDYLNAAYITCEEDILQFFNEEGTINGP